VKPDLVAPGNRIFSIQDPGATLELADKQDIVPLGSLLKNSNSPAPSSTYFILSGTSMSTAAVSGAVATLLSSSGNQNLTPDQVKARLMKTASKFPKNSRALITDSTTGQVFHIVYDAFTVGAGYLDLDSALVSKD